LNSLTTSSTINLSAGGVKASPGVRRSSRLWLPENRLPDDEKRSRDAAFDSMKVVVLALIDRIETLEKLLESPHPEPLDLRDEVSQFEEALIKAALMNTKGRQRRAARVLGMKVSTLNAKIRRYQTIRAE